MSSENIYLRERVRCETYKGLAEAYRLPEKNMAAILDGLEKNLKMLHSGAHPEILSMKSQFENVDKIEQLQVDYAQLFVGPFRLTAPPYGSVYLENQRIVMGDSTMDAVQRYADAGLVGSKNFKDAPDHIAVELEFMYYQIFNELKELTAGNIEKSMDWLFKQKLFFEDHLGRWIPLMADKVEKFAETDFYKKLAAATSVFIAEERELLSNVDCPAVSEIDA